MIFSLDWYSIGMILSGTLGIFLGFLVYFNSKDKVNGIFLLLLLSFSLWALAYGVWLAQPEKEGALFWSRLLNLGATLLPTLYLHWVTKSLGVEKKHKFLLQVGYFGMVIFALLSFSPFYIKEVVQVGNFPFWPQAEIGYSLFLFTLFFPFFIYGIYLTTLTFVKSKDKEIKAKSGYMLMGSIASVVGGSTNFLLMYGIPFSIPQLTLLTVLQSIFWAYGSLRHEMFNAKVISTDVLVFFMWAFILVRTMFFQNAVDQIIEGAFLIITIFFGVFLIRSVEKEVESREKVENLAKDLEKTNLNLTEANEKLKELDNMKSEFLSLATHQLRAPLTAIKGYASLILEGDYGEIPPKVKGAVNTIFVSCQNLVIIVNEFLDISRIEQGRMRYDLADFDLTALIQEILTELRPIIEKSQIKFALHNATYVNMVRGDVGKIKQIIGNLVDNALKYTKEGEVNISLSSDDKNITVAIKDTGIGITKEDIPKLFAKFTRAKDAFSTNVIGTGLGLYVARQMIEAQNGKIWVESPGRGKGSTFFVQLPKK